MSRFEPKKKRSSAVRIFRADPRLMSALHAIALLSALFGVAFFTFANVNADNQQADTHLTSAIEHASAQTNLLSQELDLLRQKLQPSIDQAFTADATANDKLDARAALSDILNGSPATGLVAWPTSGDTPLKIGTAPIIARPITDRTDTLHTPVRFSASNNKAVIIDHGTSPPASNGTNSCHNIRVRSTNGDWITVQETTVVCKDEKGQPDQIFLILQRGEATEKPGQRSEQVA